MEVTTLEDCLCLSGAKESFKKQVESNGDVVSPFTKKCTITYDKLVQILYSLDNFGVIKVDIDKLDCIADLEF